MQEIMDEIVDIIDSNESLIENNYKGREDLVYLPKELIDKIELVLVEKLSEDINKKEFIKTSIREAFELYESDIVFVKNGSYYIKYFDSSKAATESEIDTVAGRYNGIDEEELKAFYDNFFLKDENVDNFFYYVAKQFVDTYLIEKKINNATYEKYVFQLIQSIIIEQLTAIFDENGAFFKGFSGYIFRIHFKEVFDDIAELILFEISMSNKHMVEFLKYYSLNIVVVDGRKYKVPEIRAESGLKWNVISMMSIIRVYIKTDVIIEGIKREQESLKKEILSYYVGTLSPIEFNNNINKSIEQLSQDISYYAKKLAVYTDTFDTTKSQAEKESLKEDIKAIKNDLKALNEEKALLSAKLLNSSQLLKYNNIKKEIDSLSRQQKRDEKILSQNQDAYISIKNALMRALTSKKVPLEESE